MSGLVADPYELRMAASYLRRDMTGPGTFSQELASGWQVAHKQALRSSLSTLDHG